MALNSGTEIGRYEIRSKIVRHDAGLEPRRE